MSGAPGRATNDPSNYFAFGVQGAKDQDAGTFYFTKHLDGTGFDTSFDVSSEREGGGGREIALRYKTMVKADGQVVVYARPDVSGRLIAAALGSDVPSIVATFGPTTAIGALVVHTIQSGINATLPYLTVDQAWADETERTTNCVITDLKIEGEAGKPLKLTGSFISGGSPHISTTTLAPVREAGDPFMYPGASAWVSVSGGSGVTATSIEMTKFSVDMKNTVDESIQTLGLNREDVVWENADYSIDFTLKYTDRNIWNQVLYQGGSQVPVSLPTGSFQIFSPQVSSGGSESLLLGMPLVHIAALKVNRLDPDGKTMYLDGTGMTIRGATSSVFAQIVTLATTAYTATAT